MGKGFSISERQKASADDDLKVYRLISYLKPVNELTATQLIYWLKIQTKLSQKTIHTYLNNLNFMVQPFKNTRSRYYF